MVHFTTCVNLLSVFDFKQRNALATAFQETLPRALMIDVHTEEIDVELLRPREIFDVKHDVVDASNLEW
jgi:hypothetical protein